VGVVGTLLKNRRAGEAKLAWNLPNLSAPETLVLTSDAFADGEAIPAEHAGKRAGGKNLSPQLSWNAPPAGTAELLLVAPGGLAARNPAAGVRVLRSGMGREYLGPEPICHCCVVAGLALFAARIVRTVPGVT
jgi:hypothetical protein